MDMDIKTLEDKLTQIIFPLLENGRPGVDKPHTEAVVFHLKNIVNDNPNLNLDLPVLLIAAFAHDLGYSDLFENGKQLQMADVAGAKEQHMVVGSEKIKKILDDSFFDFLSKSQKERAIHLVSIHDKLDQLKNTDELVLMEADTLGGLDINFWKPTFDKDSNKKYMDNVALHRRPLFITKYGKEEFNKLFKLRAKYYNEKIICDNIKPCGQTI